MSEKPKTAPQRPTQLRAIKTRSALLDAARTVFARDGFEQARIEDIAAKAGKTRGAFYAHFKDKEDVFFAIFEDDLAEKTDELSCVVRPFRTLPERVTALCEYVARSAKSRQNVLLQIEFKAYAVRHPRKRKRLAALHAAMTSRYVLKEITEFVPELDTRTCSLAVAGAVEGMLLNQMFDPGVVTDDELAHRFQIQLDYEIQRAIYLRRRDDRQ